jgi:hypothetical protein
MTAWAWLGVALLAGLGVFFACAAWDCFQDARKPHQVDVAWHRRVEGWGCGLLAAGLLMYALNTMGALPPRMSAALPYLAGAVGDDRPDYPPGVWGVASLRQD